MPMPFNFPTRAPGLGGEMMGDSVGGLGARMGSGGLGRFFGGVSAFNDRNPAFFPALGSVIRGDDPSEIIRWGHEERGKRTQRKSTIAFLMKHRGMSQQEAEEVVGAGLAGEYLKSPAGAKAPQVETFYDPDTGQAYKAQWVNGEWVPVGGSKGAEGLEITLPDGTVVREGTYGNQDSKNLANRISEGQERARVASDLKATVGMLRKANQNTGYSGVGGGVYSAVDDTLEQFGAGGWLPGDAGSRATMRSGALDVALSKVEKTKGAISNAEMGMFMAAAPGLQQTPEGNAALLDMLDAIADREIMRQSEAENWRIQNGTLDGFENAWAQWTEANPLIVAAGGSVRLAQGTAAPATGGGAGNTGNTGGERRTRGGVRWSPPGG